MKRLFAFVTVTIISCNEHATSSISELEKHKFIDSFKNVERSKINSSVRDIILDTTGLSKAPVRVLYANFYGMNGRNIELKWKNISGKRITAIRFKWYGENAFNEPADMGALSYEKGFGAGFTDNELAPGKTDQGTWSIYSRDGKKIVIAWPYEIAFKDGSKWLLNN